MSRHHASWRDWRGNPNRRAALDRDGWRCRKCGKAGQLEVHHEKALADGGSHDLGNLTTLCRGCHIALHRPVRPFRDAWRDLIGELMRA